MLEAIYYTLNEGLHADLFFFYDAKRIHARAGKFLP
jgi:hypothetical protein